MNERPGNSTLGRLRLGQEIALALTVKILLLTLLWFAFFRPSPGAVKPDRGNLFTNGSIFSDHHQEKNSNDQR
jgi:hypothetical protein